MRLRFLLGPVAAPLYDVDDAPGAAVAETPTEVSDDAGSLSDHEATFSPEARTAEPVESTAERTETGQFKPRHRAASQRADIDDVPVIGELTKRLKAAEEAHGKDIVRKEGESDRVYNLRRRAELLERLAVKAAPEPKREEPPARTQEPPKPAAAAPATFPTEEEWFAKPENEGKTWYDYADARAEHRFKLLREAERRDEAAQAATRTYEESVAKFRTDEQAIRAELTDYDAKMALIGPHDVSLVVQRAVMQLSPRVAYHLASNLSVLRELTAETLVDPDNPAFSATVAATKRYLSTLVAEQRPTTPPTRTAAAPTGSAPASPRPSVPRPPNPVRTGSIAEPDTPPEADDQSLASHERFFGRKKRA